MTHIVAFKVCEEVMIVGYERECECSHCGRPLKVGVKLAGFGGVFGSDCLAKATEKQTIGSYTFKVSAEGMKERAIIAQKGAQYAKDRYGWQLGGANFKFKLKAELRSI